MASSRFEKIGTIFTRTNGLLKSGAMKIEDKPLWFDVCTAFPPKYEPRYDRPAPNIEIRPIFYNEDIIRAKYYKQIKLNAAVNLNDGLQKTNCQKFISIYKHLENQGAISEEQIFNTALELLKDELENQKPTDNVLETGTSSNRGLVSSFSNAQTQKVDISDIFKE